MRQKSAKLEDPTVQKCALHGWTGNSLLGDSQLPTPNGEKAHTRWCCTKKRLVFTPFASTLWLQSSVATYALEPILVCNASGVNRNFLSAVDPA